MPTTAQIVASTPIAVYLAANDIEKSKFSKGFLDDKLAIKLRVAYKFVKEIYDLDPNYDGMYEVCNWMWECAGIYGIMALGISGSGGSIAPPSGGGAGGGAINFGEYVRRITSANFTNGTEYNESWIAGHEVFVFWNNVNRYLQIGTELKYNPTGFTVFIDDGSGNNSFNADTTNSDVEMYVYKRYPLGIPTTVEETEPIIIVYNLTANTEIAAIDTSLYQNGTVVKFVIKPNGFTYTWSSQFVFNDLHPEQPDAIAVDTYSMYDFTVIVDELIAGDQAINISTTDNDFNNVITNFGISGVQFAETAFTAVIESFTNSTSLSITLAHFPMTTRDRSYYYNGVLIDESNIVSTVGKVVTFTGFTRELTDTIEAHYSY